MLTTIKGTVILTALVSTSAIVGSATDVAIGPDTHITLGSAIACLSVLVVCTWRISKYFSENKSMHRDNLARFERQDLRQQTQESLIKKICHKLDIEI